MSMGTFHVIPQETKEQILSRVKNDGVSAAQAAKDAGISAETVRNWLAKGANGVNNEALENARLKRELTGAYELLGKLTAELAGFKKKNGHWG
jgi:transposase-like protein